MRSNRVVRAPDANVTVTKVLGLFRHLWKLWTCGAAFSCLYSDEILPLVYLYSVVQYSCGSRTNKNSTYFVNDNFPSGYNTIGQCSITIEKVSISASCQNINRNIRKMVSLKGTQDWEFFWLRFWILCYFIVSYAQILRFCKKTFFDQATIGEIQLFRLVWD